ncbi:MAG: dihydropteroate synthase [Clostridiales bacterium]|nr:dihydropteroate synthase [Clostridiales bacterium]
MQIGNREFDTKNNTYVMGILNVTPDSFSDGGRYNSIDRALAQAERMMGEGADIIDIGGESTRPGYTMISDEEETDRVVPVIEAVKARFDIPVSLDTYKSRVAQAGLRAGADLINDIWGLKYDSGMGRVIAEADVPCCLMHNREQADYTDFETEWCEDLAETVRLAKQAGIRNDRIILDPGVGFGKTYENNLTAIRCLDKLSQFGYPVLLGTSRKSVIGLTLDVPADERVIGTVATTVYAVTCGCAFVRVHDVKENVQAIRMTQAILGGNELCSIKSK